MYQIYIQKRENGKFILFGTQVTHYPPHSMLMPNMLLTLLWRDFEEQRGPSPPLRAPHIRSYTFRSWSVLSLSSNHDRTKDPLNWGTLLPTNGAGPKNSTTGWKQRGPPPPRQVNPGAQVPIMSGKNMGGEGGILAYTRRRRPLFLVRLLSAGQYKTGALPRLSPKTKVWSCRNFFGEGGFGASIKVLESTWASRESIMLTPSCTLVNFTADSLDWLLELCLGPDYDK